MRYLFTLLLSVCMITPALAQGYTPSSTWPYLYPDFTSGDLSLTSGVTRPGVYNIHLGSGSVHFIEKDMIREASIVDIRALRVGEDYYLNVGGRMLKVLAQSDNGIIAEYVEIDQVALNSTGGAYGSSSSTAATMGLSSLEGIGSPMVNMNHMELKNSKDEGSELPLIKKLCMVINGQIIYANKRDVASSGLASKNDLKTFYKENKMKWKDTESLLKLLDFLAEANK